MERRIPERKQVIIPKEDLRQIIVEGDAQKLVEWAKRLGESLKRNGLKTHQIRRIFSEIRRIEMDWQKKPKEEETIKKASRWLIMLKPRLNWQAKRFDEVEELQRNLDPAIDMIEGNWERFRNFVDFCEAILAYHGGD